MGILFRDWCGATSIKGYCKVILRPDDVRFIGDNLDHPECLCIADDDTIYCGGEAGQIYHLARNGAQTQIGTTGGFVLGIALDGCGRIYACDIGNTAVMRTSPGGEVEELSRGTVERAMQVPNYPVFDATGNLYVSDSGDYWDERGTGCVFVIRPDGRTELFHRGPFAFANGLAIDPSQRWLYIAQTTAHNIVRVPLDSRDGQIECTHQLLEEVLPDGLAFTEDGRLLIGCYKPDAVWIGDPGGHAEPLLEDPTGELLSRPTNIALHAGQLYAANLGGWHITAVETKLVAAPVHQPRLP